jgi:hypothetical protein
MAALFYAVQFVNKRTARTAYSKGKKVDSMVKVFIGGSIKIRSLPSSVTDRVDKMIGTYGSFIREIAVETISVNGRQGPSPPPPVKRAQSSMP